MPQRVDDQSRRRCIARTKGGYLCSRRAFVDGLCKSHEDPSIHTVKNLRGYIGGWRPGRELRDCVRCGGLTMNTSGLCEPCRN